MTTAERVRALLAEGRSYPQIGAALGLSTDQVFRIRKKLAAGVPASEIALKHTPSAITQTATDDDHATLESPQSGSIRTLDELLDAAQVDRSVWQVERYVANAWTLANGDQAYQVKAWLVKIAGVETARAVMDAALADLRAHSPVVGAIRPTVGPDGHLFELTLPDLHIGKYGWGDETGHEHYDSDIAVARAKAAVTDLIAQAAAYPIERCLFLFGNDFLHYDTLTGDTTAGTRQDRDSRYHKMVRTGRQLAVWIIDRLAAIAPTTVMVTPGNHDRTSTWNLGETLAAWYHNDQRVTVNNEPTPRKYVRYGRTLLGFTHGDTIKHDKLPGLMSLERPEMWARTRYREWHIGHLHTSKVTETKPVNSTNGVRVRILQSLSGTDTWHSENGYVGEPGAAEGFIWHKERGLRANLVSYRVDVQGDDAQAAA
jgi:hypothetical protein